MDVDKNGEKQLHSSEIRTVLHHHMQGKTKIPHLEKKFSPRINF